ncbi:MAG: hypothetical protein AAFQ94_19395 [Bacteroidota bacterium]
MLPTDSEFLKAYLLIAIVVVLISFRIKNFPKQLMTYFHTLLFTFYVGLLAYFFMDAENFQGGGSLVALFYSALFPAVQLFIFFIEYIIHLIKADR